ncbi:trans-sulfuration enzyme family protein [Sinorhizobium terangae]|uniref:Cystathionine beta-lyase n=1 Tax=Sinorhizobium terangae TaxID=110322 RepID=A0A6N7LFZ4_SINTE|nr:PLP-dependent transferase [Sinorhizobium terangae]MBB4184721.1 cystathionine beta-lyase [Sinorhizobium terangae]MQX16773.1 cystathionine beta-lyase [Sinorhizobium terangae]WFU50647.1 PLP-dependent transferase [Sinorhizobium terangae]
MKDHTTCVVTPKVKTDGFDPLGVAVHRGSTITFRSAEEYANRAARGMDGYSYGLYGTPTTRTLERKITQLEQGARTFLTPSGQASNAISMVAFVGAGDKVLIADNCYPPVRDFATNDLKRLGVTAGFYDPSSPRDLERRIDDRTRMVWCESPGSTTMEIQDLPAIVEIAHGAGALVGCDNTWATPLNYKPLCHGVDIVTEALTKYVSGHSDVLMGSITVSTEALAGSIRGVLGRYGIGVSPDDAALVLRGMETLPVRLAYAFESALELAAIFRDHPLVDRVLFPPMPGCPGHELWKRDFLGASGVFSVVFKPEVSAHVAATLDTLQVFAIGASWGGTRSLVAPMQVRANRSATEWTDDDLLLRVSAGLEAREDLRADIERMLAALEEKAAVRGAW